MALWSYAFPHEDLFDRAIERAMSRAYDYPVGQSGQASGQTGGRGGAMTVPSLFRSVAGTTPMDIHESATAYTLTADAPGFEPSEVTIEEEGGVLTVRGAKEVRKEDKDDKGRIVRSERSYRSFSRSFVLPETAQPDKIQAALNHGVLSVTIPKVEAPPKPAPRRIQVGAGNGASATVPRTSSGGEARKTAA